MVAAGGGVSVGGRGFVGGGGGGAAITGRLFVSPVYDETRTETQPCPLAAPESLMTYHCAELSRPMAAVVSPAGSPPITG